MSGSVTPTNCAVYIWKFPFTMSPSSVANSCDRICSAMPTRSSRTETNREDRPPGGPRRWGHEADRVCGEAAAEVIDDGVAIDGEADRPPHLDVLQHRVA